MNNKKSMAEMSGETKSTPRLVLNELRFNGQRNKFFLIDKKGGLIQQADGKKGFNKTELGEKVNVVFLRIRRKLSQYRKNETPLSTNEHNTKHDMLTLFGDTKIIKGTNDDLREKYQGLKTVQIVYCLLLREAMDAELVRLVVKGSSLGSTSKAKGVDDFYSYISSFKEDGADDHFYEFETTLFGVEEQGEAGSYFAMTFVRGVKIAENEKAMAIVEQNMRSVYDFVLASDAYYQTKNVEQLNTEKKKQQEEDIETVEYPDDDVDPNDIPF